MPLKRVDENKRTLAKPDTRPAEAKQDAAARASSMREVLKPARKASPEQGVTIPLNVRIDAQLYERARLWKFKTNGTYRDMVDAALRSYLDAWEKDNLD